MAIYRVSFAGEGNHWGYEFVANKEAARLLVEEVEQRPEGHDAQRMHCSHCGWCDHQGCGAITSNPTPLRKKATLELLGAWASHRKEGE